MDDNLERQVDAILARVLQLPRGEQEAAIKRECQGNERLLRRTRQLWEDILDADDPPVANGGVKSILPKAPDLRIGELIGPWEIVERLDQGGMGTVYRARRKGDVPFSQQVAVKLLLIQEGQDETARKERHQREVKLQAMLSSVEGVPGLLDAGYLGDGTPYMVMEYVDGKNIAEHCRSHALSLNNRLHLFRSVLLTVHSIHRKSVLHCDLKPENILVGEGGIPKILDFGIAWWSGSPFFDGVLKKQGPRGLTPNYASPEQQRTGNGRLTEATDVFLLGVVLRELVGSQPLAAREDDSPGTRQGAPSKAWHAWRWPGMRREKTPRRLSAIIRMATAARPEKRYASAAAFADDVQRYLAGDCLAAESQSWPRRALRRIRGAGWKETLFVLMCAGWVAYALYPVWTFRARHANALAQLLSSELQFLRENSEAISGPLVRRVLLADYIVRCKKTMQVVGETENVRLCLGNACQLLGSIEAGDGDLKRAIAAVQEARDSFQELIRRRPDYRAARLLCASANHDLASYYLVLQDMKNAQDLLSEALRQMEQADHHGLDKEDGKLLKAGIHRKLALVYLSAGAVASAAKEIEAAQQIVEPLAAAPAASERSQTARAEMHLVAAAASVVGGKPDQAIRELDRSLLTIKDLRTRNVHHSDLASYRFLEARLLARRAITLWDAGQQQEACRTMAACLVAKLALSRDFPRSLALHQSLNVDVFWGQLVRTRAIGDVQPLARQTPRAAFERVQSLGREIAIAREKFGRDKSSLTASRLVDLHNERAQLCLLLGSFSESRGDFQAIVDLIQQEKDVNGQKHRVVRAAALNHLAWYYGVLSPDEVRDTKKAVAYAERAAELVDRTILSVVDTLLMAYVSNDQTEKAVDAWAEMRRQNTKQERKPSVILTNAGLP